MCLSGGGRSHCYAKPAASYSRTFHGSLGATNNCQTATASPRASDPPTPQCRLRLYNGLAPCEPSCEPPATRGLTFAIGWDPAGFGGVIALCWMCTDTECRNLTSTTTVATAIVLLQRFYLVSSMREHPIRPTVSAALCLSSKLTEQARRPRDIINVLAYILSVPTPCPISPPRTGDSPEKPNPETCYVPESSYFAQRTHLLQLEAHILRALAFQTHIALPYTLAINYLQALDALKPHPTIVKRTFGYLTDAVLSPSLLYLTHQPNALAVAAIYLAARECGAKMPDAGFLPGVEVEGGWWDVFDVDREELGFLVVCLKAVGEWVGTEVEKWRGKWGELLAVGEDGSAEGLERELERRRRGEE